jgi:hypothetical protein
VPARIPLRLALTTNSLHRVEVTGAYRTAIDRRPLIAGLGSELYVSPGSPGTSLLWRRMGVRENEWRMPPVASELVDTQGMAAVRAWIEGLGDERGESRAVAAE